MKVKYGFWFGIEIRNGIFLWFESVFHVKEMEYDDEQFPVSDSSIVPEDKFMGACQLFDANVGLKLADTNTKRGYNKIFKEYYPIDCFLHDEVTDLYDQHNRTLQEKETDHLIDVVSIANFKDKQFEKGMNIKVNGQKYRIKTCNFRDDGVNSLKVIYLYIYLPKGKKAVRVNDLDINRFIWISEHRKAIIQALTE